MFNFFIPIDKYTISFNSFVDYISRSITIYHDWRKHYVKKILRRVFWSKKRRFFT